MTDRELLIRYMKKNGLTQRKMATVLGISPATMSRFVRGTWPISTTVSKLLHMLTKEN